MARSYSQFCGLARALDVVGERWTLLVVRELLVGPARYGRLAEALPGIASNLLADRLRALVVAEVVERRLDADGTVVYALTPWGEQLREPVDALVRWSTPLMRPGRCGDAFRPEWLLVGLRALLSRRTSHRPVLIGIETAGLSMTLRVDASGATVERAGDSDAPHSVLTAGPDVVLGLASGEFSLNDALIRAQLRGERGDLEAVFAPAA